MNYVFSCRDLTLEHTEVKNLSLDVHGGEYLCIVGENGAGKTTFMRAVLGLLPKRRILGGDIVFADDKMPVGYLPQRSPEASGFPITVLETVLSGRQGRLGRRPFYGGGDREAARLAMERLGISGLSSRSFRTLSGGQQQKTLLARALCAAQDLLMLDEPASALDPEASGEMYRLISELHKSGMTVVMITHDAPAAVGFADRILHIGRSIFIGSPEDYAKSEQGKLFLMQTGQEGGDGDWKA